jgi:Family of unknown function (DUF5662)
MKHLRYLRYLARHKWFVLVAGLRVHAPLWRLLIHDWSKFLPSEWFAYAQSFYGPQPRTEETKRRFNRAWLHHQHFNPHHWQHWVLHEDSGQTKVVEMPLPLMREMVADWAGAGRGMTGKWEVRAWYWKNQPHIQLNPVTRYMAESLLDKYFHEVVTADECADLS